MVLRPATSVTPRIARSPGGMVSVVFGLAALIAGFWTQFRGGRVITEPSDLRLVLPLLGIAVLAGIVSLVRRETQRPLAIAGIAMAAAAPLLGWVVLVAVVAAVAVLAALIIAKFH